MKRNAKNCLKLSYNKHGGLFGPRIKVCIYIIQGGYYEQNWERGMIATNAAIHEACDRGESPMMQLCIYPPPQQEG